MTLLPASPTRRSALRCAAGPTLSRRGRLRRLAGAARCRVRWRRGGADANTATYHQQTLRNLYHQLMAGTHEAFAAAQYDVAYHALMAPLHCAQELKDGHAVEEVERIAAAQLTAIDAQHPEYPHSTRSAAARAREYFRHAATPGGGTKRPAAGRGVAAADPNRPARRRARGGVCKKAGELGCFLPKDQYAGPRC